MKSGIVLYIVAKELEFPNEETMEMIPDEQYEFILKNMPVFCVDWLIRCGDKYLLLKRKQQPLKGRYWHIGGRLRMDETIPMAAKRLQERELGRFCGLGDLIAFSNYNFIKSEDARATHTPAITFLVDVDDEFTPKLDETESDYIWTESLPRDLMVQSQFVNNIPLKFKGMV